MANTAPRLFLLEPTVTFAENTVNAIPQLLDTSVVFADGENNFVGGTLIVAGLLAEDIVSIQNQTPTSAGPIGFSGGIVTYLGTAFGTVTGGVGTPLTVTFDANAYNANITALIQALTFQNTSDTPTLSRVLSVTVTDADGAATTAEFTELVGAANPFDGLLGGSFRETAVPVFADFDADGDLDAVVGTRGSILYFENTGTALAPVFVERTGVDNPFGSFSTDTVSPTIGDLDGDGDLDVVLGQRVAGLRYLKNEGTSSAPVFFEQSGVDNPFSIFGAIQDGRPALADLDNDGDLDLTVGGQSGTLRYFMNTGTNVSPAYAEQTGAANPFNGIDVGNASHPTFTDFDNDGDLDLAVGERDGIVNYFENAGTAALPNFAFGNLNNISDGAAKDPAVADLDGDGDFDVLMGNRDGTFQYFLNIGTAANPVYSEQTGVANPMNGVSTGGRSTSFFADLNDDGLVDVVTGARDGTLRFYLNTGTASVPVFMQQTGAANPFDGVSVVQASTPTLGDVDGDGDLDAVIGSRNFNLRYFENTGSAAASVFTEQTGGLNPFNGIGGRNPVLADVDSDGDLDAVVGHQDNTLHYYENTGTTLAPVYIERTGVANPFTGIIERDARFALADFDGDGDLDIIVGDRNSSDVSYYENIGSATAPVYFNPLLTNFFGVDVGQRSTPTFADLNGDGTLELIAGDQDGFVHVFDRTPFAPSIGVNVLAENDPPQLTDLDPSVTFAENTVNATPQILDASVTFTDPEGNFDGGVLRVYGLLAEDIVSVRNQGTGAGEIGFLAGTVSFEGMAIGTAFGGVGGILTVVLNANATSVAVDALIQSLTYQNTSDTPVPSRTLTIQVFDSDGATSKQDFVEVFGAANPFEGLVGGSFRETSVPVLADLDGDGDLDAVVGTRSTVQYFENTGTALAPVYVEQTGAANPFSLINFTSGRSASPTLVDFDNDGDLDAVVGEAGPGRLHLYENTGTALAPAYTEITFTGTGIDLGRAEDPAAADLDGDGDLDLLVGDRNGNFHYYVNVGTALAPSYVEQFGAANPMSGVGVGGRATSAFSDLNGDGLTDVVVGNRDGILRTFYNTGTTTSPVFTEQTGAANLFDGVDVGQASTPSFGDLDGDGDLDAVVGGFTNRNDANSATLRYFLNTGTVMAPVFVEQTGAPNPFDGFTQVRNPVLADVDGDGDLDAVVGAFRTDTIRYFENTGTTLAPSYVEQTGAANPFAEIVERDARFALTDFDSDGDLDIIVGNDNGAIVYYVNVGTPTAPVYTVYPFGGDDLGGDVRPTFADLDNDGDADLVVGRTDGNLRYFENVGTAADFAFVERIGSLNPFNGISVGRASHPTFTDLDNDGDLDLAVGERDGIVNYFENAGTAAAPNFSFGNLSNIAVGAAKDPAVADLDGDGDLDVLMGNRDGTFQYFLNTGTAANPLYSEQTGAANPMNGVDVGQRSTSTLADLNGDGLIDALVGNRDTGTLRFYLNTGTAAAPAFTEQTGAANPFDGFNFGGQGVTPTLGDIDGDGDLDAVIGSRNSFYVRYLENTGITTAPSYVERTGVLNPFNNVVAGRNPVLVDVDGDGDLDAVVGNKFPGDERVYYYENTGTTTAATFIERTGIANPFDAVRERDARFALADFDGDGDLDAVFGDRDGQDVSYYENIGTATAPVYYNVQQMAFFGVDVGQRSTPTFADLDGDGRVELIAGDQNGLVHVYDNRIGESEIIVNVTPEGEFNLIFGTPGPDKLTGTPGVDVIDAGKGNDTVNAGDGNDTFIAQPGDGNDTYNGGDGSDTLDLSLLTAPVRIRLGMPVSSDKGRAEGKQVQDDTLISIENVIGGSGNDQIFGNNAVNLLDGRSGNDRLYGYGGDDTLIGGDGNDLLDGGTGADDMSGGTGNDTFLVDHSGDTVSETTAGAPGGIDLVKSSVSFTLDANVENLTLTGTAAADGTGNAGANIILGNTGANTLDGGIDSSALFVDQLKGGAGNDTYIVRDAQDVVIDSGGKADTVNSFVNYILGKGIENLELQGSAALDGTGNTLANQITGNAGANTLNGMAGKDTLTGGGDADVFVFNTKLSATTNVDTIVDFGNGADGIQLENAIFTKLGAAGPLNPNFFVSAAGAVAGDSDDYIVYDTTTGILFYDTNGNLAGGSTKFAVLTGAPALTAADFEII